MKFCNVTKREFLEVLEGTDKIICWGAGKNAAKCIKEFELDNKIAYFVDSNIEKNGTKYEKWDVYGPEHLEGEKGVLLITPKTYYSILEQIWDKYNELNVYCYVMMQDFLCDIHSLQDIWYYKRLIEPSLQRFVHNLQDDRVSSEEIDVKVSEKGKQLGTKIGNEYPLILPRLVVFLTEKCSLNCVGCCAFVDKFKDPKHMSADRIIGGLEKIFENIDGCMNVQLAGGETFLYPELAKVLTYLLNQHKCEKIGIITNGTIIPSEETFKILSNPKIFIEMSDYGLIDIQAKVIREFEKHDVNFKVFCEQVWSDYGDPEIKHGKSEKDLCAQYAVCPDGFMCKQFDGERIYSCGRAMRMHHINVKGYDYEQDSTNVYDKDVREGIRQLYLKEWAQACDYCLYMSKNTSYIPVGIQRNDKLVKSEYTIVSREEILQLRKMKKELESSKK